MAVDGTVSPGPHFAIAPADPVERNWYRRVYGTLGCFVVERMTAMKAMLKRFVADERGLETVEYAVMTSLVVAAVVIAVVALQAAVKARFDAVTTAITP